MIQDIAPHTYHNEYKPVAPDENSIILAYENGKSFFSKEDSSDVITLPRFRELEDKAADLYENYIYLFSIDEERFYLIPDWTLLCCQAMVFMKTVNSVMYSHSISLLQ